MRRNPTANWDRSSAASTNPVIEQHLNRNSDD
jgi:hypothetical protein